MALAKTATKKRTRDATASKARILEVAMVEFSKHGYNGARVEAIAQKSKSNINLVYHYFGNKENLFTAVMEQCYAVIRSRHDDFGLRALSPEEAIRRLTISTFRMFIEFPELIGLFDAENVMEAKHIKNSAVIRDLYNPLIEFIDETLKRGTQEGVFRHGIDPVELFLSINAEGYFYLSNRYTLSFILHQSLMNEERLQQREEFIVDVIMRFLRP